MAKIILNTSHVTLKDKQTKNHNCNGPMRSDQHHVLGHAGKCNEHFVYSHAGIHTEEMPISE